MFGRISPYFHIELKAISKFLRSQILVQKFSCHKFRSKVFRVANFVPPKAAGKISEEKNIRDTNDAPSGQGLHPRRSCSLVSLLQVPAGQG